MSAAPELPDGWVARESVTKPGKVFYFNKHTGKTQWTHPSDPSLAARKRTAAAQPPAKRRRSAADDAASDQPATNSAAAEAKRPAKKRVSFVDAPAAPDSPPTPPLQPFDASMPVISIDVDSEATPAAADTATASQQPAASGEQEDASDQDSGQEDALDAQLTAVDPQRLAALTRCALCSSPLRDPRLLQCLHSFCADCLRALQPHTSGALHCPLCDWPTPLVDAAVDRLPRDTVRAALLDQRPEADGTGHASTACAAPLLCGECPEDSRLAAEFVCVDCRSGLCAECREGHARMRRTRHHAIVAAADYTGEPIAGPAAATSQREQCSQHEQLKLAFYCYTCGELVCAMCVALEHTRPTHDYVDVASAVDKFKAPIKRQLSANRRRTELAHSAQTAVDAALHAIEQRARDVEEEVISQTQKMIKLLEARQSTLLEQLQSAVDQRRSALAAQSKSIARHQQQLADAWDYALCAINANDPIALAGSQQALVTRLRQLNAAAVDPTAAAASNFELRNTLSMRVAIEKFGAIVDTATK